MTTEFALVDRGYKLLATGLVVTRVLTYAEWRHVGECLMEVVNRTNWAIGDWLVYGDGRGGYGETYAEAARITGRSFESLSQSARVSSDFPLGEPRRHQVPWSIYREALRLEPALRDEALGQAASQRWTRDQFARACLGWGPHVPTSLTTEPQRTVGHVGAPSARLSWRPLRNTDHHRRVQCPRCGHRFEPNVVKEPA